MFARDSIYILVKGDTVFKTVYRDRFKYKLKRDTITRIKEIVDEREVVKEVEVNRLRWWQEVLMWAGVVGLVWAIIRITILIVRKR